MAQDPDLAPLRGDGRWEDLVARAASTPRPPSSVEVEIRSTLGIASPRVSRESERALTVGRGEAVLWDATDGSVVALLREGSPVEAEFDVGGSTARTRGEDGR